MTNAATQTATYPQTSENAPDFTAPIDGDGTLTLSSIAASGKACVLYFYPKDDTPGCTTESKDFRDNLAAFEAAGAVIVGLSRDTVAKHDKFKAKHDLTFALVSDEDGSICEAYGTWVEKSMYGKKYMGIERATYLIAANGTIAQVWRKVKVKGHVEEVLEAVRGL